MRFGRFSTFYAVIVLEAFATYIGQLSVLSLIALFGAATTAMVSGLERAQGHKPPRLTLVTNRFHAPRAVRQKPKLGLT